MVDVTLYGTPAQNSLEGVACAVALNSCVADKQLSLQQENSSFCRISICNATSATNTAISPGPAPRVTFTNPQGQVLQPIRENVWAADRPFIWNTIDVGGRMTVIRVSGASLLSPPGGDSVPGSLLVQAAASPAACVQCPMSFGTNYQCVWIEDSPKSCMQLTAPCDQLGGFTRHAQPATKPACCPQVHVFAPLSTHHGQGTLAASLNRKPHAAGVHTACSADPHHHLAWLVCAFGSARENV